MQQSLLTLTAVKKLHRAIAAAALAGVLGIPLHADVVTLAGKRTVRVVAVEPRGGETALELLNGGTLTVSSASIKAIELEPLTRELCAASPYRCQDRAMLLSRTAHAKAVADKLLNAPPPAAE